MKRIGIVILVITGIVISCASNKKSSSEIVGAKETSTTSKFNSNKLDSLLSNLEKHNKWMGSVAVSEKGNIIYSRAIGYKDAEGSKKSNTETIYRIGSISKTYTTVMIMKAVEEGKIKLSETIDSYFPKVVNAKTITVENLLNHRSGIYNFTNKSDYLTWNTKPISREELIKMISDFESDFEPNSKSEYSNSNYVLLSFILEDVYEKPFKEILKEKILDPIKTKYTYYGSVINPENNEAFSYSFKGNWKKENETDMSLTMGAGSLISTPSDLNLFATALFDYKLIKKSSVEKMITIKDNYGLGIFVMPYFDNKGYGHTGGIDGFSSMLSYFPDHKLSVAICANANNYSNNDIGLCALSSFFNDGYFTQPNFETVLVKSEELDKYLGIYASTALPFKITFTKKENTLLAFPEGQLQVALDSKGNHIFDFVQAKAVFEFDPEKKTVTLKQGGGEFLFTKE